MHIRTLLCRGGERVNDVSMDGQKNEYTFLKGFSNNIINSRF